MMNKHICRAKRAQDGAWVYGYYWTNELDNFFIRVTMENGDFVVKDYEVDPDTVCQCIGWCDSDKTPIFEKDIVEFVGANSYRYFIWWCNEMNTMTAIPLNGIKFNGFDYFNVKDIKSNYSDFCFMMQDPWGDFKEIKVIGNIIDNPELLAWS